ncbi:MAG: 4Fe-4S dicluster domain-containing protein [Deltaproteobacteria bacterium]|jgi:ferredoxin|nr:4Fe-4S dicluster domain-containing protein [Deltaproteobacteria bacterium]
MLRKIRTAAAIVVFTLACFLFVSGSLSVYFTWVIHAQLVPAILSGSLITAALLLSVTMLFGRLYCSVLCPLGILQDIFSRFGAAGRFQYSKGKPRMRLVFLLIFVTSLLAGTPIIFNLLEPYSAFGRIAAAILSPVWQLGINVLARIAEHYESYLVSATPVWIKGAASLTVALLTLLVIGWLSYRGGRSWCNTVCPVGTALGFLNRYALIHPRIKKADCVHCGICAKKCKASCIDSKKACIDASRCVVCLNCLDVCPKKALSYTVPKWLKTPGHHVHSTTELLRRNFAVAAAGTLATLLLKPASVFPDSGEVDALTRKRPYRRAVPVLPPGAHSLETFSDHCTGCQLCVSICPNQVLSVSGQLLEAPQPNLSFERGYCRPNCVDCSNVCPTGAIRPITLPEKSALQIGMAVAVPARCLLSQGEICVACSRNCPTAAIEKMEANDGKSYLTINTEHCTGCGACEYYCPIRPQAAIQVRGNDVQRLI